MGTKTQKLSNVVDQIVEWQSVFTGDGSTGLTAVAGRGYFIDTTSGAVTVTLPASPKIGDTVTIADYATTFATNNVTINPNGNKIEAGTANGILSTNDQTHTLVYTDSTQGWKIINQDTASAIQPAYISATGGTVTTSGDYKIHTFTGDGCFVVSSLGVAIPCAEASTVDYIVVAGGGGAGGAGPNSSGSGGGGAGGFRESKDSTLSSPHTASPLAATAGLTVSATTYPVTVGAGGSGGVHPSRGANGSNSVFSTITSTGGGGGSTKSSCAPTLDAQTGGSGGGGSNDTPQNGAAGNTPPTSPPQGNPGGNAANDNGAGGGGAGASGSGASPSNGGAGGAGVSSSITGSSVARAGGGGGAIYPPRGGTDGSGGTGGGGSGLSNSNGNDATANTGGGGGGTGSGPGLGPFSGGSGGKGIVIIRYKYQ
jgi:hypothetical protein